MSSDEEAPTGPSTSKTNDHEIGEASSSAVQVLEEKPPVNEYIRLRVINSDMTNEVQFRVKARTALGRLKRSYCSRLGIQLEGLRFCFDGHRIIDEDTPESLNLIDNDVIEIYQERSGGM